MTDRRPRPRRRRDPSRRGVRRLAVVATAVGLLAAVPIAEAPALLPPLDGDPDVVVTIEPDGDLGPLNRDLVGFNWRAGAEAIAPVRPHLVRLWSVDLSRITPAPGVYDWTVPDAETDAIRALGATPLIVLVGRPPWSPLAGSPGYEASVRAAVQRYGVDRVPAGVAPAQFESGNEPEFPPTSHGQLLTDLPLDAAAQGRAVAAVEATGGGPGSQRWGGPGALFPDPAAIEAFVVGASLGGRRPDFLSWHTYTNQPLLGPDGAELRDPVSELVYSVLRGTNPVATPALLGLGVEVVRLLAGLTTAPDGSPPDLVVSEWNLSSGGLDRRNDTAEGAAHTLAGLIELQRAGADAATFFASVDRHCPRVDGPDPRCGDWGIATADGEPKPVWWAFDWWHRLAGDDAAPASVVPVDGASPLDGVWALATRGDDGILRVLLASFSVLAPTDRTVRLAGASATGPATVRRLVGASGAEPVAEPVGPDLTVTLPANSAALVEIPVG